jgi:hypothetical protein
VERELVVIIDRIERGAGWLTTQEEKRAAAKLAYEIAFAKARYNSDGRSAEQRNDDALLQCLDLYEEWQQLELVCRTAREGLHNLRSMVHAVRSPVGGPVHRHRPRRLQVTVVVIGRASSTPEVGPLSHYPEGGVMVRGVSVLRTVCGQSVIGRRSTGTTARRAPSAGLSPGSTPGATASGT